jgi:hypothetical protein
MNGLFKLLAVAVPASALIIWLVLTQQEQQREQMQETKQEFKQQIQKFDEDFADAWVGKTISKPADPVKSTAGESQEAELRNARTALTEQLQQEQVAK